MELKCIVTGGAGFIGSHLTEKLVEKGCRVKVIDNFSTGNIKNLEKVKKDITVIEGDITDPEFLNKEFRNTDLVYHEAAIANVQYSIENPVETEKTNVIGTLNVLSAAKECHVKRVVFASSAAVYGDSPVLPKKEDFIPEPLSPYAVHKLSSEYYLKMYNKIYGLETVALRYFNVFGPRQDPSSPYSGVISIFLDKMIQNEAPVVFGDGEQTRDFIYIRNIVEANILAGFSDKAGKGEIFNVGTGTGASLNKLIQIINQCLGRNIVPKYAQNREGDIRHSLADISRIRQLLEFQVNTDFNMGIKLLIKTLKNDI